MYRIIIEASPCDGGLQIARIYAGEDPDEVARRYGAVIRDYGPYRGSRSAAAALAVEIARESQSLTDVGRVFSEK